MTQAPTSTVPTITKDAPIWGTGRRKTAIARVRLLTGDGTVLINGRQIDDYFPALRDRAAVRAPLVATDRLTGYTILINVKGGGTTGQADAVKLGIARALKRAEPELEPALRAGNFLTRDPRMVERKKPGQRGARRRFQFSKR